jgi:hypothetical protein
MHIKQQDLEQNVGRTAILDAFQNSMIDMSDCRIRSVDDLRNTILVQTDDQLYQIVTLGLEMRHNKKLYITKHSADRTYSAKSWQDTLGTASLRLFPPPRMELDMLHWLDIVTHFLKASHPDQEYWTDAILGVCAEDQMILVYDEPNGRAIEMPIRIQDGDVFTSGIPIGYWDLDN